MNGDRFQIEYGTSALEDLDGLPSRERGQVIRKIERLQDLWNLRILVIAGLLRDCGGCIELDVALVASLSLFMFIFVEAAAAALWRGWLAQGWQEPNQR